MTIPGHRLMDEHGERIPLNSDEMMRMFHYMEDHDTILSIFLMEGRHRFGTQGGDTGMPQAEDCDRTFPVW